jgi:hypothetical protein
MNISEYKFDGINDEDPFINNLLKDMNTSIKIHKNSGLYISHMKLNQYKVKKNFTEDDLPLPAYYGIIHLIKNNSIIIFNQTIVTEHLDIRMDSLDTFYRCIVTIYNLDLNDISEFSNITTFIDMNELISHNRIKTFNFMRSLIKTGFKLYIKNKSNIGVDTSNLEKD